MPRGRAGGFRQDDGGGAVPEPDVADAGAGRGCGDVPPGCTPIVNLFEQTAEPIALTQARYEYRLVPDVAQPMGMEVYSVDEVTSADPTIGRTTEYEPFYSFRHGRDARSSRRSGTPRDEPSTQENDRGTDVYLNLVDLDFKPRLPAATPLVVRTTCTNRDLPATCSERATVVPGAGGGGPAGRTALRAQPDAAAAPAAAPRSALAAAVAPEPQPPVDADPLEGRRRCRKSSACTISPTRSRASSWRR